MADKKKDTELELEKVHVQIKSKSGAFVDVTQPNGGLHGAEIKALVRTERVQRFIDSKGLAEIDPDSKIYKDYLKGLENPSEEVTAHAEKSRSAEVKKNNNLGKGIAEGVASGLKAAFESMQPAAAPAPKKEAKKDEPKKDDKNAGNNPPPPPPGPEGGKKGEEE